LVNTYFIPLYGFELEACKKCLLKTVCTKDKKEGTLCEEAIQELKSIVLSYNDGDK
jgi:hypothetical protein